ncbi:GGDEF domain-containing protein [Halomonas urumqiensis]|nr:GGDEF domain-containing protein [Halomonas urumqiensis]
MRVERLVAIADGFQRTAQEDLHATRHELQRQLRRQRKITHIADRYQALLGERNEALLGESHHDALTGLANRRLMHEYLEQLLAAKQRHHRPFTVAMIDIDHFKRINDQHGHAVGDQALVLLTEALQDALRTNDLCGRWGGEEFLVILPETTLEQAEPLMSRLCQCMRQLDIHYQGIHLNLTASMGVAEHRTRESIEQTLQRADKALLQAKREGRDRWLAAS